MAQISRNAESTEFIMQSPAIPKDGKYSCSFCGKPTSQGSFWHGPHQTTALCIDCLKDGYVMGALIGDAILDNHTHIDKKILCMRNGREILDDVDSYIKQMTIETYRTIIIHLSGMISKT